MNNLPSGVVAAWAFTETAAPYRSSVGTYDLLVERGAAPKRLPGGGIFIPAGTNLYIPCAKLGRLNVAKTQAVTVLARVKRRAPTSEALCIAGIWDETAKGRQYALFHHLGLVGGYQRPYFHVSRSGGATPKFPYAVDGAATKRTTTLTAMQTIGGTYANDANGEAWAYMAGTRDSNPNVRIALKRADGSTMTSSRNPYIYRGGLNPASKAPFRVNAANGHGLNSRNMELTFLVVWDRALSAAEMLQASQGMALAA